MIPSSAMSARGQRSFRSVDLSFKGATNVGEGIEQGFDEYPFGFGISLSFRDGLIDR